MGFDPLTIGLFALLAVMVIFMFRNSRKRAREQEELRSKIVPGAEIMTSQGIFGTLLSIDDEKNEAIIETTPGTLLRVHRQTLSKVVEPEVVGADDESVDTPDDVSALDETPSTTPQLNQDSAIPLEEPEFGERTDEAKPKRAPRKKAAE